MHGQEPDASCWLSVQSQLEGDPEVAFTSP